METKHARPWSLVLIAAALQALGSLVSASPAAAGDATTLTPDRVLASLNQALGWYQQARVAMQSVDGGSGFADTREEKQTALTILQRAFDVAHAQAAALATEPSAATSESATERDPDPAQLEAKITQDEADVARLGAEAKRAPAGRRLARA